MDEVKPGIFPSALGPRRIPAMISPGDRQKRQLTSRHCQRKMDKKTRSSRDFAPEIDIQSRRCKCLLLLCLNELADDDHRLLDLDEHSSEPASTSVMMIMTCTRNKVR